MTVSQHCRIAFIGAPIAAELPRSGLLGNVVAVFHRSCYLETPQGQLFCIADRTLGQGPLTLGIALPSRCTMSEFGVAGGARLEKRGQEYRLGRRMLLHDEDAAVWLPPQVQRIASHFEIRRRLGNVIAMLQGHVPSHGLAPLVPHVSVLSSGGLPDQELNPEVARLAIPRVARLAGGVVAGDACRVDRAVGELVGLGPGLTPSGDDLLAGLMVAMIGTLRGINLLPKEYETECPNRRSGTDVEQIVSDLATSVTAHAIHKTTRVSQALLAQAVKGNGNAAQHTVLGCLLESQPRIDLVNSAVSLASIGHTSGWDALVGLLLGVNLGLQPAESAADRAPARKDRSPLHLPVAGAAA